LFKKEKNLYLAPCFQKKAAVKKIINEIVAIFKIYLNIVSQSRANGDICLLQGSADSCLQNGRGGPGMIFCRKVEILKTLIIFRPKLDNVVFLLSA